MNELINTILTFLGTAGLLGFFIWIMIAKQGWKIAQIVAGVLLGLLVAFNFPKMPPAVNSAITGIVNAIK
jgi:hypothetical protein